MWLLVSIFSVTIAFKRESKERKLKHLVLSSVAVLAAASLLIAGCGQSAPAPTSAPASPTKATEQSKPAAKTDYPAGKPINMIVPWAAGGANDIVSRALAAGMEKELNTSIPVVNKAGAGGQIGMADAASAKPDGYTIVNTALPSIISTYLEADRKSTYNQSSFQPIALQSVDPIAIVVKADSPYKTLKDLIDAAKSNPEKVTVGSNGVMSINHMTILQLQKAAGVKFAIVQFNGGSEQPTALLGGHIDVAFDLSGVFIPQVKSGNVRVLAIADTQDNKYLPGVPTIQSAGYNVNFSSLRAFSVHSATPKPIVDVLAAAAKNVITSDAHVKKMEEAGIGVRYMDPDGVSKAWAEQEDVVSKLMAENK